MGKYTYVVLGIAKPGRVDDHRRWYAEHHIKDVFAQPGVTSARLLAVDSVTGVGIDLPQYSTMAAYELEVDDIQSALSDIRSKAGTDEMQMSDAAERTGSIHLILREIGSEQT